MYRRINQLSSYDSPQIDQSVDQSRSQPINYSNKIVNYIPGTFPSKTEGAGL